MLMECLYHTHVHNYTLLSFFFVPFLPTIEKIVKISFNENFKIVSTFDFLFGRLSVNKWTFFCPSSTNAKVGQCREAKVTLSDNFR